MGQPVLAPTDFPNTVPCHCPFSLYCSHTTFSLVLTHTKSVPNTVLGTLIPQMVDLSHLLVKCHLLRVPPAP